jgi:hypothetical protein
MLCFYVQYIAQCFLIYLYEVSCGTTTRQSKCASLSKFKRLEPATTGGFGWFKPSYGGWS